METNNWREFYLSRVNSERYKKYFKDRYKVFLDIILSQDANEIFEAGCGLGTVSLILKEKGIKFSGIDLCKDMAEMANINTNSNNFFQGDIFQNSTETLTVTHGVLEHFEDECIINFLKLYPNSIHYVPLDKYVTPSFGDERLLPYKYWIDLINPTQWELFNDDHDLVFKI